MDNFDMEGLSVEGLSALDPADAESINTGNTSYMDDIGDAPSAVPSASYMTRNANAALYADPGGLDEIDLPEISEMHGFAEPSFAKKTNTGAADTASEQTADAPVPAPKKRSAANFDDLYVPPISAVHEQPPAPNPIRTSPGGSVNSYGGAPSYSSGTSSYTVPGQSTTNDFLDQAFAGDHRDYENGRTIVMIISLIYAMFGFFSFLSDLSVIAGIIFALKCAFAYALFKGIQRVRRVFIIANIINPVREILLLITLASVGAKPGALYILLTIADVAVDLAAAWLIMADSRVQKYFDHC